MKSHLKNNIDDPINFRLKLYTITNEFGWSHYYDHLKFRSLINDDDHSILKKIPSVDDYEEFKSLRDKVSRDDSDYAKEKIAAFEADYDWRDQLFIDDYSGKIGLISANGEKSLPPIFDEIRELPDTLFKYQRYVPVRYGDFWGIVTLGTTNVCVLPFKYNNIIMERWNNELFFVQDKEENWGVNRIVNQLYDDSFVPPVVIPSIEPFVPCEFDAISEGELHATCSSVPYWVLHKGDKFGVMTPHGYTPAIFDAIHPNHKDAGFCFIVGDTFRKMNYFDIGIILANMRST